MKAPEITELKRERNKLRKALKEHAQIVKNLIRALDEEMKKPSDVRRGQRIARIINLLELENDRKRHFTLKEKFPLSR